VLSWRNPVAPTDIEFVRSSKLGDDYENNILVGNFLKGNLYYLKLNEDRNEIIVTNITGLSDRARSRQ
jgi:aldose sugar dehydrogenase